MGLIRSGQTELTPMDDDKLTDYLWPIVREMVKTAIENRQNLIVEGCYIPFNWAQDFSHDYLREIKYCCLIMSESYIREHFSEIRDNASAIEQRLDDSGLSEMDLIRENDHFLHGCIDAGLDYFVIRDDYEASLRKILAQI